MHGLNTYDYGARQYNPVTVRWDRMDRFATKYYHLSPYTYCAGNPVNAIDVNGDSIRIDNIELQSALDLALGVQDVLKYNNGVLVPESMTDIINKGNAFADDLYNLAINNQMIDVSLSEKNTYLLNGVQVSKEFDSPADDSPREYLLKETLKTWEEQGWSTGKCIRGNLGQTLFPTESPISGKKSLTNNVSVVINAKGTANHRAVGLVHEFSHVALYLSNRKYWHPDADTYINVKTLPIKKRLGYDL